MTPTEMHIDALMEKIEKLESENARYLKVIEAAKDLFVAVDVREWPNFGARKFNPDPSVNATIAANKFKEVLMGGLDEPDEVYDYDGL